MRFDGEMLELTAAVRIPSADLREVMVKGRFGYERGAGDPGRGTGALQARHRDPDLAVEFVDRLGRDLQDESRPIEGRSLVRMLLRWKQQIAAWQGAHVSDGPTEAANNSVECVKRAAFGPLVRNYRVRVLLHAGKPNWDLLAAITPR